MYLNGYVEGFFISSMQIFLLSSMQMIFMYKKTQILKK
jgi:hypothetical protein